MSSITWTVPTYLEDINSIADLKRTPTCSVADRRHRPSRRAGSDLQEESSRPTTWAMSSDWESSTPAMLAGCERHQRREPIVVTCGGPIRLRPVRPKDRRTGEHARQPDEIHAVGSGFVEQFPDVATAIENMQFDGTRSPLASRRPPGVEGEAQGARNWLEQTSTATPGWAARSLGRRLSITFGAEGGRPRRHPLFFGVGPVGLEPTTSCSQSTRATKLRHGPCLLQGTRSEGSVPHGCCRMGRRPTWRDPAWRCYPVAGPLAQLAEQRALNPLVQGSSPWGPTTLFRILAGVAELEDAPGLGPGGRESVEVRVLSPAPGHRPRALPNSANARARCENRFFSSALISAYVRPSISNTGS